jgi:hypothetical protein
VFVFNFGMISSGLDPSSALLTMVAGELLTEFRSCSSAIDRRGAVRRGAPALSEAKHQRTDLPPSAPVDVPACLRCRDHRLLILDDGENHINRY